MFCKAKSAKKKLLLRGDFRPLSNKNVQMLDHFCPLLFPKDSESLKILDIRLREVGAKRPLNGTSKVNRQTHRRTHKHTDRRTFRLIESIGPEGRCFENHINVERWVWLKWMEKKMAELCMKCIFHKRFFVIFVIPICIVSSVFLASLWQCAMQAIYTRASWPAGRHQIGQQMAQLHALWLVWIRNTSVWTMGNGNYKDNARIKEKFVLVDTKNDKKKLNS